MISVAQQSETLPNRRGHRWPCLGSEARAEDLRGVYENDERQNPMKHFIALVALTLVSSPSFAATEQCRLIDLRKDREACYERQSASRKKEQNQSNTKGGLTAELAKSCQILTAKAYPPRVIGNPAAGSANGTGPEVRAYYRKCVEANGMINDKAGR